MLDIPSLHFLFSGSADWNSADCASLKYYSSLLSTSSIVDGKSVVTRLPADSKPQGTPRFHKGRDARTGKINWFGKKVLVHTARF
jgi:hypothetical protein